MSKALEYVELPKRLPTGTTWKQWRLAVLAPRCATAVQALEAAGYSRITAVAAAKRAFSSVGVLRAQAVIQEQQRDRAREIKRKAGNRVNSALDGEGSDPNYALSAWATASKIAAEYPDENEGVGEAERGAARAYIGRVITFAFQALASKVGYDNMDEITTLSLQLADSIALAAENSELTEYRLSDDGTRSPQVDTLTIDAETVPSATT